MAIDRFKCSPLCLKNRKMAGSFFLEHTESLKWRNVESTCAVWLPAHSWSSLRCDRVDSMCSVKTHSFCFLLSHWLSLLCWKQLWMFLVKMKGTGLDLVIFIWNVREQSEVLVTIKTTDVSVHSGSLGRIISELCSAALKTKTNTFKCLPLMPRVRIPVGHLALCGWLYILNSLDPSLF